MRRVRPSLALAWWNVSARGIRESFPETPATKQKILFPLGGEVYWVGAYLPGCCVKIQLGFNRSSVQLL